MESKATPDQNTPSPLSLLIDSISCLLISCQFSSLWSSHISGQEYEVGNGEVKAPSVPKKVVDATRVRVLETAKRQLHKRMKISSAPNTLVTFGILVYGFSFEVYIVRFLNGYYPYEKVTWGELPRFNKVDGILIHALRSMLILKHSMEQSLADPDVNPGSLIESNLLPTVSYIMVYKDEITGQTARVFFRYRLT
ncbi:hypothetical protein RO3G_01421 [Rhizopus delemar RA 99-880]|uniref:Uncharacterized protein n=1 Tax=Rhizopus delemar (strain RA 99-880 / ATCC MYA-4621 / FGSC 9543 / NRRL 43880) TaxID=246409 RepID=I1BKI7_RHIO9|nr:hypothetical protein RO3G_01421 [Rhizopus delemar RA 99-880]|eukprot:EIE76717.1 hypothetical protein RO3G_01421 [Rhizopus delemar RA 99-880]